jgi:hypothetical protein
MNVMSRRARAVLNEARPQPTLPRATRQRLLQELERRLALGEQSALQIDARPPQLPDASPSFGAAMSAGTSTALKVALGVVLAMAGYGLLRTREDRPAPAPAPAEAPVAQAPRAETRAGVAEAHSDRTRPVDAPSRPAPLQARELVTGEAIDSTASIAPPPARLVEARPPRSAPRARSDRELALQPARHASAPDLSDPPPAALPERPAEAPPEAPPPDPAPDPMASPFAPAPIQLERPPAVARAERAPRPPPASTAESAPGMGLDEEMELLAGAHTALREGLSERALVQLAEHTWRFPNGQLAEARDVARILALCSAGRQALSRSEVGKFLARHPGSPFASRVRTICR